MPKDLAMLALVLAACAAPNPTRTNVPAPWQPKKEAPKPAESVGEDATPSATQPAPATDGARPTASATPAPAASDAQKTETSKVDATKPDASKTDAPKSEPSEPVVATVAGSPVYVSELLSQWMYTDSLRVLEELDKLAVGRLVVAEAQRLGVRVDPALAKEAYQRGVEALETEIKSQRKAKGLPELSLDRYVERILGLDPIRYREKVRDDALRSLLGERVMRGWILSLDHAFVRVIVTSTEADMKVAQQELAAGAKFEDVAKKRSEDKVSREDGGRIAPIAKSDKPMSQLAFATDVGQVGGPIENGGKWLLLQVVDRTPPVVGNWDVLGPAVEKSLKDQHVDELEFGQWKEAMLKRYEVSLKPFLKLVGEDTK